MADSSGPVEIVLEDEAKQAISKIAHLKIAHLLGATTESWVRPPRKKRCSDPLGRNCSCLIRSRTRTLRFTLNLRMAA
jgi:hypothetical protein